MNAKLTGANLSCADLRGAFMYFADLHKAVIRDADFTNAGMAHVNMSECKGDDARFINAYVGDSDIKNAELNGASFMHASICDSDFSGAKLEDADFAWTDMDNAVFKNTDLKGAYLCHVQRSHWSDFSGSDMTGAILEGVDLASENLKGVKGLYLPIYCPEEGAFIAWKKCRAGKVVKLLIPEHATRKGTSRISCRASEAVVLEIFDKEGKPAEEAVSIVDKEFLYRRGETVYAKKCDEKHYGDVSGIHFVLSRAETDRYKEKDSEN